MQRDLGGTKDPRLLRMMGAKGSFDEGVLIGMYQAPGLFWRVAAASCRMLQCCESTQAAHLLPLLLCSLCPVCSLRLPQAPSLTRTPQEVKTLATQHTAELHVKLLCMRCGSLVPGKTEQGWTRSWCSHAHSVLTCMLCADLHTLCRPEPDQDA